MPSRVNGGIGPAMRRRRWRWSPGENEVARHATRRSLFQRPLRLERLEDRLVLSGYFVDSFEAGLSNWTIPNIAGHNGTVELIDDYSVNPGGHSLAFDGTPNTGVYDLNEAILTVELSSMTNPILTFHQLEGLLGTGWGDENHELADYHVVTGPTRPAGALGDGLTVSNDGTHWYKIYNVLGNSINRGGDGLFRLHEYDLAAEIDRINDDFGVSLVLGSNFRIKFSQYDNDVLWRKGWAIDKVQITDQPQYFDTSLEPNVFHRLNLPSEDGDDYLYRVALFGDVDENTPVLVSVHGAGRGIYSSTTFWHRFVAHPANGVDDLIIVSPWYVKGGRYDVNNGGYQHLSWNNNNDAASDLVLLDTLDVFDAAGIGYTSEIKLFGFSGGGQFSERFTWAHPERVDAVVVGAPSTHTFPYDTPDWPFKYGVYLPSPWYPPPPGVTLDIDAFLKNRIMFWVGELDNDPNHSQLERNDYADMQGLHRLERAQNMYAAVNQVAADLEIHPVLYEYEMWVEPGQGHGYEDADAATFYEFLFRPPKVPGDADRNGVVDDADMTILAAHWGMSGMTWNNGDFDNDGIVGPYDAAILAAHWGETSTGSSEEASAGTPPGPDPVASVSAPLVGPVQADPLGSARRLIEPVGRENVQVDKTRATAHDAALAVEYGPQLDRTTSLHRQCLAWSDALVRQQARPRKNATAPEAVLAVDPLLGER